MRRIAFGVSWRPSASFDEVALALELPLERAQRLEVVARLPAEGALDRLLVDRVEVGAGEAVAEGVRQRLEVGQLGERVGGLRQAHAPLAVHRRAPPAAELRSQGAQVLLQGGHLGLQVEVGQRLVHRRLELRTLLGAHRVEHALHRCGATGQVVDELLDRVRCVREEVAVLVDEVAVVVGDVLAALVLVEQLVEVGHHLLERLPALRRRHAVDALREVAELLVDDVALQALPDLVEGGAGLVRAPVVRRQLAHGTSDVRGDVVEQGLAEARVVGGVGEQRGALGLERRVEQVAQVLEQAVHAARLLELLAPLPDALRHVLQALAPLGALAHEVAQRLGQGLPAEDALREVVDAGRGVGGRRERVGAAVEGAVPVARHARRRA